MRTPKGIHTGRTVKGIASPRGGGKPETELHNCNYNKEQVMNDGAKALIRAVLTGTYGLRLPYDDESWELKAFLSKCERLGPEDIERMSGRFISGTDRFVHERTLLRYLACVLPTLNRDELSRALHGIMSSPYLQLHDVRRIVDGTGNDIVIEKLQHFGQLVTNGTPVETAAVESGISKRAALNIESFLGLRKAWKQRTIDLAVDAVRNGWTRKQFCAVAGVPSTTGDRYWDKALSVLREIGEEVTVK
jgi:hypothetical protein